MVLFWAIVEAMSDEDCSKVLAFVTGSPRVPAIGFSSLQGYGGRQQRFTVQRCALQSNPAITSVMRDDEHSFDFPTFVRVCDLDGPG